MFYSQSLLSRKGPLGNIWIAAYCFNKLKREQIAGTDITSSVDKIMPEVQISYRILAQLLLGIVRIFSKKVDYLYHDCNEALTNIRRSFIPSQHNVRKKANSGPQDNVIVANEVSHASKQKFSSSKKRTAAIQIEVMRTAYHAVTISLPERFELDAFDLEVSDGGYATESAKTYEEFILEEEPTNERTQDPFVTERCYREMDAHFEHSSAYLAPIDDIIPSYMMDIDVQNSEYFNSSYLAEGKGQKAQEDSPHLDELDNRGNLGASISEGPHSLDEQSGHQNRGCFNSSSLAEGEVRKAQEDSQHQDELESHGNLGVGISEGPRSLEQSEHQVKFQETNPSNMTQEVQIDEAKIQAESTNLHSTKPSGIKESHEKSNLTDDAGLPSPKFAVATPAKRETSRILRKRKKNPYDENIVLPNEILRMWIHDASNLVCKRRKAPHTTLDAWKVNRMINLQECFMEPIVPCNSLERIATPQKKPCDPSPLKKSQGLTDPAPVMNDIPNNFSDPDYFLLQKTSTDTMTQTDNSELLKGDTSYEGIIKESHSLKISKADTFYEGIIKESHTLEIPSSGLDILDQEIGSAEKDNDIEADGWSTRTRVVAQYLCRSLLDLNGQKRKKIQGLARILEGQTRAKCARFFCETLTLKSHDYIDVKQDHPYSDIIISATPRLEAFFKNR